MIHGILIDLDDTLSDDQAATEQAIITLCATHLLFIDEQPAAVAARWIGITDRCWRRYLDGELSLQGQRRERIRQFIGQDMADGEADLLFGEYLLVYEKSWRLAQGADSFLAQTAGIPMALVSNGDARQVGRKVAALGLQGRFAAIVTPEDAGAAKPLPPMFLHALRALGLPAEQCIMVGDSLRNDVEPALALGMRAFHIDAASGQGLREAAEAIAKL